MNLIHFILKHRNKSFVLISIILCVFVSLAFYFLKLPFWLTVIVNIILILTVYVFVTNCFLMLYKKPLAELNDNCDPYPILELTERVLTYDTPKELRNFYLIYYVSALSAVGEHQKALGVLNSVKIDEIPLQSYKVVYYFNFMAILCRLRNYDEAKHLYPEFIKSLSETKNQKQQQSFAGIAAFAEIIKSVCDEEYDKALQLLGNYKCENNRDKLSVAMYYAEVYLALNEKEKAKENLEYIIENGNKLYCVTEAR